MYAKNKKALNFVLIELLIFFFLCFLIFINIFIQNACLPMFVPLAFEKIIPKKQQDIDTIVVIHFILFFIIKILQNFLSI